MAIRCGCARPRRCRRPQAALLLVALAGLSVAGCAHVAANYPAEDRCRSYEWIGKVCGAVADTDDFVIRVGERLPVEDTREKLAYWDARKSRDMTASQRASYMRRTAAQRHPVLSRINADEDHTYYKAHIILKRDCRMLISEGAFVLTLDVDGELCEEADSGAIFSRRGRGERDYVFTRDGPAEIDGWILNRSRGKPNGIKIAVRTRGRVVGLRLDPERFQVLPPAADREP